MLNQKGIRELAYIVIIDDIEPIIGSDNCECAVVNGWHIMVRKNEFKKGDVGIYFEIDSYLDSTNPAFSFMEKKKYKVKTQRYTFGGEGNFISQGLLMSAEQFGWHIVPKCEPLYHTPYIVDNESHDHHIENESRFLTKQLGVTYAEPGDNTRKAPSADKYAKMARRHRKLFSHQPFFWLMQRDWGKELLFLFFGRRHDKKTSWPAHICAKTDVERIQNMMWILKDKQPYIATEKVDGSSCTITAERGLFGKIKYQVCSRNVVFEDDKQKCFYPSNIYFEVYEKYNLKEKITKILNDLNLPNIALQMEIYGEGIQRRDYSINEHNIAIFHIVSNGKKFPMNTVIEICKKYNLPCVPIINDNYIFPDTIEELQAYVEGEPSLIDKKIKEGIVFYDKKTGQIYTKFVSPEFLMKFH